MKTLSKTVLTDVRGFTPVIDSIVEEHGLVTAAVFGAMWRYCQMRDGVCRAPIKKIADRVQLNRVTVMRHVETLVASGYLKDLTPKMRNRPHVYMDTGKAKIEIKVGVAESNT